MKRSWLDSGALRKEALRKKSPHKKSQDAVGCLINSDGSKSLTKPVN